MDPALTVDDHRAHLDDTVARIEEIDTEFAGQRLPDEVRAEWNSLNQERDDTTALIEELEARTARVEELRSSPTHRESGIEGGFQVRRPGAVHGDDIYDLTTVRSMTGDLHAEIRELRDRAMRSIDAATFPHPRVDQARAKAHVSRLVDTIDGPGEDKVAGELARRILVTGSPAYRRAFGKQLAGQPLTSEEARALSVGTGSAGGFAIVYTLDPTIIPISNLNVNPWRAIASVETIAGTNEWRGVTSGAVTATRVAEGTEATDNAPTLAQPALIVTKVHTFIPFSIEIGQDWGGLQSEMARLIQDAKDVEEGASFATGNGTTPNPQGVITGATNLTTAGGVASFAVADVYKLWESIPPRFRPNATWVANLFTYDKIRQFDTAGGASLFVPNLQMGFQNQGDGTPAEANLGYALLQRPAYESSDMAAALTTGTKIAVAGDFSYYKIVDRIGMDIELVPQLFGATSRFPTGQRGIYAYWRNYGKVLDPAAFRVLVTG